MDKRRTIRVIPYRYQYNPTTGQRASVTGAAGPEWEVRDSGCFTVEIVDHRGSITRGMGSTPPSDRATVEAWAARLAERRGYRVIA